VVFHPCTYYVDVEISYKKKTMSHAGVRSIPAVQVFKDGKVSPMVGYSVVGCLVVGCLVVG
jgi:hypothetical protein